MSKKWITFLVAAAIGALLLPTIALADCRVDVINTLSSTQTATGWKGDPVPVPQGDLALQLFENPATPGTATAGAFTEPVLNAEGVFERVADVLITDDGSGTNAHCFHLVNNTITLSLNGVLTSPAAGGQLAAFANVDAYDSAGTGGLAVTASTSIAIGGGNTQKTVITVTVSNPGTDGNLIGGAVGAAVRIKNLRFDATSIPAVALHAKWSASVGGPILTGNAGANGCLANPSCLNAASLATGGNAGAITTTLVGASVAVNAAITAPANGVGYTNTGTQNSGSGLTGGYAKLPTIQQTAAGLFRRAAGSCAAGISGAVTWATASSGDTCASGVANDVATVATSLAFAMTGIPSAVTVTWPSNLNDLGGGANPVVQWSQTSRGGSPLAFTGAIGSGSDTQVFDTTTNTAQGAGIAIETADNADPGTPIGNTISGTTNPNCVVVSGIGVPVSNNGFNAVNLVGANCDPNPKVGVFVANPSGQGRVSIQSAFGRGTTSLFTGDDVAAAGVFPAYTGNNRAIVTGALSATTTFFTITPLRTTLLFPYVTTAGGFNTGIAVVNTCSDANVFLNGSGSVKTSNTCTTTGGITFYFFGTTATGTVFNGSLNTDLGTGGTAIPTSVCPQAANLDSNGRLGAGKSFACGASGLASLISSFPANWTGYVLAVLNSSRGHGFSAQFNGAGAPYAANSALVVNENATGRFGIPVGAEGANQ